MTFLQLAAALHRFLGLLNLLCDRLPNYRKPVLDQLGLNGQDVVQVVGRLQRLAALDASDPSHSPRLVGCRDDPSPWEWIKVLSDRNSPWLQRTVHNSVPVAALDG